MLNNQRVAEPLGLRGSPFGNAEVNEPIQDPPQVIRVPTPGALHIVKRRGSPRWISVDQLIEAAGCFVKKIGKFGK